MKRNINYLFLSYIVNQNSFQEKCIPNKDTIIYINYKGLFEVGSSLGLTKATIILFFLIVVSSSFSVGFSGSGFFSYFFFLPLASGV